MKHFLLALMFITVSDIVWGQNLTNQEVLLQKCVDLPALQEIYSAKSIYVMQHGVSFHFNELDLSHNRKLVFLEKPNIISSGIHEFFLFKEFQEDNQSAHIIGQYVLNFTGDVNDFIAFDLQFKKEAQEWELVKSEIKENKL